MGCVTRNSIKSRTLTGRVWLSDELAPAQQCHIVDTCPDRAVFVHSTGRAVISGQHRLKVIAVGWRHNLQSCPFHKLL